MPWNLQDAIGRSAATTLGFIGGNVYGAYYGYRAYPYLRDLGGRARTYLNQQNMLRLTGSARRAQLRRQLRRSVPRYTRTRPLASRFKRRSIVKKRTAYNKRKAKTFRISNRGSFTSRVKAILNRQKPNAHYINKVMTRTHEGPSATQGISVYNHRWPQQIADIAKALFNGGLNTNFPEDTKIDVLNSAHTLEVYNPSQVEVQVKCYTMSAGEYHSVQAPAAWDRAWQEYNHTVVAVPATGGKNYPNAAPSYPAFSKYYKTLKTSTKTIKPGETVKFTANFNKATTVDLGKAKQSAVVNDYYAFVPAVTCSMMLVSLGQLVTQFANADQATYSKHNLTVVETFRYKMRCPDQDLSNQKSSTIELGLGAGASQLKTAFDYTVGKALNQVSLVQPKVPNLFTEAGYLGKLNTGLI
uniref:Uncharacterized protein n=1 Tax=Antarctic circular DNA molecule TaxID=2664238 RepID=A0A5Q2EZ97_9ZZZZ|nr:hypothetical protein [Antarctic circular DNA molecule]